MGKLKQLHILSNFVVGKHEENGIQDLGGLLNLQGSFEIQKLENVNDVNQARSARIIDKKHIDELLLEWSSGDDMVSDTQTERGILHALQPHTGLKVLRIYGYKGNIFPDWIGHSFYKNMTRVYLLNCKNCCMLPSLGQLPSLKSLRIEGFGQINCIGDEFYKNEDNHSLHIAPFPSLEILEFHDMACWEGWHLPDSQAFPQLKRLGISDCQMLKGDMLNHVLMRIISSSLDVSKVRKLKMQGDNDGWGKDMSLNGNSLSIRGFESVVEYALKAMIMHHLTSGCSSAIYLQGNYLPKSLQKLTIRHCRKMELLQQQHEYDLVELQIEYSCDSLTSLSLDAFPNLKNLDVSWCKNLESVSKSEPPHTVLQRLSVSFCNKLEALPHDMSTLFPNLQSLDIQGCPNICRLPGRGLKPNLNSLTVGGCEKQLSSLWLMSNLSALTHLTINGSDCDSVKSFPDWGSLPRLPSLTTLHISKFHNLETLECNQLLHLTSLQCLHIQQCYKLKNMAVEKLPSSLFQLQIVDCPLLGGLCKNKHQ
ncbi:putative disease resistance protein At3g14460 [Arachis ipaensis]|nr:putative disease resistance protein At3g14460 [Arachis ipaensis]